jgi:hypothetical protein
LKDRPTAAVEKILDGFALRLETRRAIDNDEFGRLQATIDEIVEKRPPL